jgi:hypothetical protein
MYMLLWARNYHHREQAEIRTYYLLWVLSSRTNRETVKNTREMQTPYLSGLEGDDEALLL